MRYRKNHSVKFLLPQLNTCGSIFLKQMDSLTNYGLGYSMLNSLLYVGIGDIMYYRAKGFEKGHHLFLVFDVNGAYNESKGFYLDINQGKKRFKDYLMWVRTNKYYFDDYWFGKNQHCIVFNIKSYESSYSKFWKSEYSKMYRKEQLKDLGIPEFITIKGEKYRNYIYAVLTKEDIGKQYLKNTISEYFGVDDIPDDPREYDITWFAQDEILNYKYSKDKEKEIISSFKN